ncbi:Peroxisomal membrane protein PMP27 [Coemansia sp. RSA 2131]|nr:Peroxisomal membrane protein PMP27 [Coemansia sp. RSA 2131]KAJ2657915.1 Peroxisomal membrane protein PMP27 [Coemansia sp. RSA 1199]
MDGTMRLVVMAANSRMVDVYVKYIGTLVGRDKACRLGQYFARLMAYVIGQRMARTGKTVHLSSWLVTLTKVQQTLGTARKVMRAGKFVSFLQLAVRTLMGSGDEVERVLSAVHKLGMCVFMAADTWGLLGALSLVRVRDATRVTRVGQRGWMWALVAQLTLALYGLRTVSLRAADLHRVRVHVEKASDVVGGRECAVEEEAIRVQRAALARQLAAAALDLCIPVKGLGIVPLNEGLVAAAGTITSLMGVQDVLAKS